ncbi:MAG: hypothetical protein ACM3JJ_03720 [Hyphomicrobiales bacterium]
MKREVPVIITLLTGIFCLIGFFVPHPAIRTFYDSIQQWVIVIVGATYVLGVANVLRINVQQVSQRQQDWPYKIVLLLGLFAMMIIGFSEGNHYLDDTSKFSWMYRNVYTAMSATMFALLAFFIASAAFRAFRIRTFEALLLAIAAFILMIGRVPIGNAIHPWIPITADWLMEIPQNAAKRGILIGAALGVMATGIRIILGIEKTYGGGEGGG